jgi:excinuclease ABC subunit B
MSGTFHIVSDFDPTGDQPEAIRRLVEDYSGGRRHQVLLGVTGSGKTFTMANVIAQLDLPTLVIAHNKTLAAQLYQEFKVLFPGNAVEYFVSYYDYYQPEAYLPATDTYIEKDSSINDEIDRMRHAATRSILTRRDTIVIASVSCIYGIGSAESYAQMLVTVEQGRPLDRNDFLRRLVEIQYDRNDYDLYRGSFRVRGDTIEVFPPHEGEAAVRIETWDDEVTKISIIDPLRGQVKQSAAKAVFFPGSHYVSPAENLSRAVETIKAELDERLKELDGLGKLVEKQRLRERTLFDIEMLESTGYCTGIENYSRHLSGRGPGEAPPTLLDYFPKDFLLIIDESHQTVPQILAMYKGDRSRKETLVEYGFRLPSALDNRPLKFEEFNEKIGKTLYVSATPGDYEMDKAAGCVAEQIIRPTGLVDPEVEIVPAKGQVDDVVGQIRRRVEAGERVLVCTLTKKMAEDLTEYMTELGIKAGYLHADVETLDRVDILKDLRMGTHDVLVGINLLREGLDLPEVSLVSILDADREGFLRSARSLIQMFGRAARNINGKVILYADTITDSIREAVAETERRRKIQVQYNEDHNITPQSIQKAIRDMRPGSPSSDYIDIAGAGEPSAQEQLDAGSTAARIDSLRAQMLKAAELLDFERAAALRDVIRSLSEKFAAGNGGAAEPGAGRRGKTPARKRPKRRIRR